MAHVTTQTKALLAVLLGAMLLCSCNGGKQYPYSLVVADSLLDDRPDSAMHVLHGYADSVGQARERDRMYYHLLLTTAEDKCYVPHTSDSVMRMVVEYYEDNGPADKLADAYRIMGRVYDDMLNAPTALEYYKKAIEIYTQTGNYKKLCLTYDHLGVLYYNQYLYEESVDAYRQSYACAMKSHTIKLTLSAMRTLGRTFTMLNDADSALYYYNRAFDLGDETFKKEYVAGELAMIYLQLNDFKNAYRVLSYDRTAYVVWAEYYKNIGDKDSAQIYYAKVLGSDNKYAKEEALRYFADNEREQGNADKAFYYIEKANLYKDSIFEENMAAEVKRVEAMYNYEKIEAERKQLSLDKTRQSHLITILIAIILFLTVSSIGIYERIRRKMIYMKEQGERTKILKATYSTKEPVAVEDLPLCLSIIRNSTDADFKLMESSWKMFFEEIDLKFSKFTLRLRVLCPSITDVEIVVCCLVKLDIPVSRIANMLCKSSQAISNLRKRLYEKIHGKTGSSHNLDEFIRNF